MTTTEYSFSIYNLTDKVDRIANAIFKNYPFFNHDDREAIKVDAKSALWMKYEQLHEKLPGTDDPDQYENACVRHAITKECKRVVDNFYRTTWNEYYEWEWLKDNFDRLFSGYTIGTYAYAESQLTTGDPFSRIVVNGGDQAEYADFNEAFSNLSAKDQSYLAEPEREDMGTHLRLTKTGKVYYGRALRKLHREMNNIAGSRMNKTNKREAKRMEELHQEMLAHIDSISGKLAKVDDRLEAVTQLADAHLLKTGATE
ncbi:hypothetical protein [Amycolatopsis sp. NPDC003731]